MVGLSHVDTTGLALRHAYMSNTGAPRQIAHVTRSPSQRHTPEVDARWEVTEGSVATHEPFVVCRQGSQLQENSDPSGLPRVAVA
jgi:hypothetical protein